MALSENMKKALFVSAYLRAKAGKPVVRGDSAQDTPPAKKHGLEGLKASPPFKKPLGE